MNRFEEDSRLVDIRARRANNLADSETVDLRFIDYSDAGLEDEANQAVAFREIGNGFMAFGLGLTAAGMVAPSMIRFDNRWLRGLIRVGSFGATALGVGLAGVGVAANRLGQFELDKLKPELHRRGIEVDPAVSLSKVFSIDQRIEV